LEHSRYAPVAGHIATLQVSGDLPAATRLHPTSTFFLTGSDDWADIVVGHSRAPMQREAHYLRMAR
jgi:hypothetical protein